MADEMDHDNEDTDIASGDPPIELIFPQERQDLYDALATLVNRFHKEFDSARRSRSAGNADGPRTWTAGSG
jgi:hypothetical protein